MTFVILIVHISVSTVITRSSVPVASVNVSVLKKSNLQRHYKSVHSDFDKTFPVGNKVRKDKVKSLKANLHGQQNLCRRLMSASDCVTKASTRICWVLVRKQKANSDGEIVKACFQECADSLFAEFRNKEEIKKQISDLQLSH